MKPMIKLCKSDLILISYNVDTGFMLLLNLSILWIFHAKIRKFHDLFSAQPWLAQRARQVCTRILPWISHLFWAGMLFLFFFCFVLFCFVLFFKVHILSIFHNFWHFCKISVTSPGLEISHSNFMTFPGFPWPHEPCWYTLWTQNRRQWEEVDK